MLRQMVWAKDEMVRLRTQRGNKCEECSVGLAFTPNKKGVLMPNLEFAHTWPTKLSGEGRGLIRRVVDIRQHPACYKLLCNNCHHKFDYPDP